jgi:hypothetical protein
VVAAVLLLPAGAPPPAPAAAALPAWSALPPEEADAGLELLEAVGAEGGLESAWPSRHGPWPWVEGLSEDDAAALVEAVRADLGAQGRS